MNEMGNDLFSELNILVHNPLAGLEVQPHYMGNVSSLMALQRASSRRGIATDPCSAPPPVHRVGPKHSKGRHEAGIISATSLENI